MPIKPGEILIQQLGCLYPISLLRLPVVGGNLPLSFFMEYGRILMSKADTVSSEVSLDYIHGRLLCINSRLKDLKRSFRIGLDAFCGPPLIEAPKAAGPDTGSQNVRSPLIYELVAICEEIEAQVAPLEDSYATLARRVFPSREPQDCPPVATTRSIR